MTCTTTQSWEIGQTVKVGFMSLTVRATLGATYILTNKAGDKLYAFEPYTGCRAITAVELRDMRDAAEREVMRMSAQVMARAARAAAIDALFA